MIRTELSYSRYPGRGPSDVDHASQYLGEPGAGSS